MRMRYLLLSIFFLFLSPTFASDKAILLKFKGAIGPVAQAYIQKGISQAKAQKAQVVTLQLNTPGGLSKSMRAIIEDILRSKVPVVTYVAPSGARAASAGTYILYASAVAAMAEGTHLGAATPIALGMPKKAPPDRGSKKGANTNSAVEKKAMNDAIAYIRSLAELHGRNVKWAEGAVSEAETLTATQALKMNVIDVIAKDIPDLLKQINGKRVKVAGEQIKLNTGNLQIYEVKMDWKMRFLSTITDPNIAYILLLIGIYGLFFEFMNPGTIVPGVIGGISLLLAIYALHLLPISYVGAALMFLGIAFMVGEVFLPGIGVLGIGGVVAFAVGSVLLLGVGNVAFGIAFPIILAVTAVTAIFFLVIIQMAIRSRFKPKVSGNESLIGQQARIFSVKGGIASVKVNGERWQINSHVKVKRGDWVEIIGREDLYLQVEKIRCDEQKPS